MGQHFSTNIQLKLDFPNIPQYDKTIFCKACKAIFQGTEQNAIVQEHHTSTSSFGEALREQCYICTSMWDRLSEDNRFHLRRQELPSLLSIYMRNIGTADLLDSYHCYRLTIELGPAPMSTRMFHFSMESVERIDNYLIKNMLVPGGSTKDSLDVAHGWYTSCRSGHDKCKRTRPSHFHGPTRLIEIDVGNGKSWKLLDHSGARLPGVPYATLSHCWGLKPLLRLTSSTMAKMKKGMPVSALPKTFRDAITVARRFNMPFIWIDSLCILQDSAEDWLRESIKMKDVYVYADFNIAATAASCSSDGGFYNRPASLAKPCNIAEEWTGGKDCVLIDIDYLGAQILDAPLNQRAWVVQERILSPRIIHLGKKQLFWECDETFACEDWPRGIPGSLDFNLRGPFRAIESQLQIAHSRELTGLAKPLSSQIWKAEGACEGHVKIYLLWERVVELYTRCSLTKKDDKLVALSGIAQLFKEALEDDEYLAGLWKKDLLSELLWCTKTFTTRFLSRAPSWSWASVDGVVKHYGRMNNVVDSAFLIEILDAETHLRTKDPTGQVSGGVLNLKGLLLQAWHKQDEDSYGNLNWITLRAWGGGGAEDVTVTCRPDTETSSLDDALFCLPIQEQIQRKGNEVQLMVHGIVLVEKINLPGRFRRVAYWEFSFQNPEKSLRSFGIHYQHRDGLGQLCAGLELRTITIE